MGKRMHVCVCVCVCADLCDVRKRALYPPLA